MSVYLSISHSPSLSLDVCLPISLSVYLSVSHSPFPHQCLSAYAKHKRWFNLKAQTCFNLGNLEEKCLVINPDTCEPWTLILRDLETSFALLCLNLKQNILMTENPTHFSVFKRLSFTVDLTTKINAVNNPGCYPAGAKFRSEVLQFRPHSSW